MRRSRKPLVRLTGLGGSNPPLSASLAALPAKTSDSKRVTVDALTEPAGSFVPSLSLPIFPSALREQVLERRGRLGVHALENVHVRVEREFGGRMSEPL